MMLLLTVIMLTITVIVPIMYNTFTISCHNKKLSFN